VTSVRGGLEVCASTGIASNGGQNAKAYRGDEREPLEDLRDVYCSATALANGIRMGGRPLFFLFSILANVALASGTPTPA